MLSFEKVIKDGEADEERLYFLQEKINEQKSVFFLVFVHYLF